jgi:hypothetical protein
VFVRLTQPYFATRLKTDGRPSSRSAVACNISSLFKTRLGFWSAALWPGAPLLIRVWEQTKDAARLVSPFCWLLQEPRSPTAITHPIELRSFIYPILVAERGGLKHLLCQRFWGSEMPRAIFASQCGLLKTSHFCGLEAAHV